MRNCVSVKTFAIVMSILCVGVSFSLWQGTNQVVDFKKEVRDRRTQTCLVFERTYKSHRTRLMGTYEYLDSLTAEDKKSPINAAIITFLPNYYSDAKNSFPPKYCSEKGVGIKGPIDPLPKERKAKEFLP